MYTEQKGKIYYTDCETGCVEEICDGEDNDCDGLIDADFTEKEKRIGWLRLVRPGLIDTNDPDKLKPDAHLALQAKLLGGYFLKNFKIHRLSSFLLL